MSLSMYQASVTAFAKSLSNLKAILEKAKAHALEQKIEESVYTTARLYPDMLPLTRQVQIATDIARGGAARLAGVEPPVYEDSEKTFDDLTARIERTLDYMTGLDASAFEDSATRAITRPVSTPPRPTRSCGTTACRWGRPTLSGFWIELSETFTISCQRRFNPPASRRFYPFDSGINQATIRNGADLASLRCSNGSLLAPHLTWGKTWL